MDVNRKLAHKLKKKKVSEALKYVICHNEAHCVHFQEYVDLRGSVELNMI